MSSPTYGDVTQLRDLPRAMLRTRARMADATTTRDLDIAMTDYQYLRAEEERRVRGGKVFVGMDEDPLDLDDTPEPENSDEEPDQVEGF